MFIHKSIAIIATSVLILTGCDTLKGWVGKRDNGSLDYQHSQKINPIQLPEGQKTAEFAQLYPTPTVGENRLDVTNDAGTQYELPKPPQAR